MERRFNKAIFILALIAAAGIIAWAIQFSRGLVLTHMRNPFSWGIYIATWAFYVGTAAGGLVVSSAIYIFGAKKLKPVASVASLTAFIFVVGAMLMVLPDLGRPDRLYNFFIHPNPKSMLPWDILVLSGYAVVSALYTYTLLRPDILSKGITLPYFGTVLKKNLTPEETELEKQKSERNAKRLAPIALPLAILIHTVTAWVLATQQARPWWYGGVLAPTFIAAALTTGPAVVIIASVIAYGYQEKLKETYALLAKVSAISAIILLFMYYNDFFIRFWWNTGREFEALKLVFTRYLFVHAAEVVFVLLAVFIFTLKPKTRNWLLTGSVSALIGVFAHRFLLIPPAYNLIPLRLPVVARTETLEWSYPIAVGQANGTLLNPAPIFVSYWHYVPSVIEIIITAGILAIVGLLFLSALKFLPITKGDNEPV